MTVQAHRTPALLAETPRVVTDADVVEAWLEELVEAGHRTLLDRLLDREEVSASIVPVVATISAHLHLQELNASLDAARTGSRRSY
jgi:hypothetical protein